MPRGEISRVAGSIPPGVIKETSIADMEPSQEGRQRDERKDCQQVSGALVHVRPQTSKGPMTVRLSC